MITEYPLPWCPISAEQGECYFRTIVGKCRILKDTEIQKASKKCSFKKGEREIDEYFRRES